MKITQYIFLAIVTLLASSDNSLAQTFTNSPNDTIKITGGMEDIETLSIQQIITSTDIITFKWKKVSESVPANWEASVCDNQFCYTSLIDSGTMNPVSKPDYGLVLLHITAHINFGTSVVRYAVWDIKFPAKKDTLTFILTVKEPLEIKLSHDKNAIEIYPNPAYNNFNIISNLPSGFQFRITDIVGKQIYWGTTTENNIKVSTETFPNGIYTISVFNKNKTINPKRLIIQH